MYAYILCYAESAYFQKESLSGKTLAGREVDFVRHPPNPNNLASRTPLTDVPAHRTRWHRELTELTEWLINGSPATSAHRESRASGYQISDPWHPTPCPANKIIFSRDSSMSLSVLCSTDSEAHDNVRHYSY